MTDFLRAISANLIGSISEDLAPVLVTGIIMMIPIVSILVKHQQKMALIMRENPQGDNQRQTYELESIKRELADLKTLMHQQAIAMDNLTDKVNVNSEISRRLENVN